MTEHTRGEVFFYESPEGKVLQSDFSTARNCTIKSEIKGLECIVSIHLDNAEEQYARYRVRQDREFESDFEREVKRLKREDE